MLRDTSLRYCIIFCQEPNLELDLQVTALHHDGVMRKWTNRRGVRVVVLYMAFGYPNVYSITVQ
jgi:hypothetical protein